MKTVFAMNIKSGSVTAAVAALALTVVTPARATTIYTDQASFMGSLGSYVTDTYSASTYGYTASTPAVLTDAAMSAAFGETTYQAITHPNINIVGQEGVGGQALAAAYCAGCNGNFQLGFGTTSVTQGGGIYGFGFEYDDFPANGGAGDSGLITFANGSTQIVSLASATASPLYFGMSSSLPITSFTLIDAQPDIAIADLTIGAPPIPLPAAAWLLLSGLGGLGLLPRRKVTAT